MKSALLFILLIAFFLLPFGRLYAQSDQTAVNGGTTTAENFSSASCAYSWTNSNPSIGLPAGGTGNIPPFTAINKGNSPVKAVITATPVQSVFAYVANQFSNNVSVVNTKTNKVVITIPVGAHPTGVSANPDGSRVYVTNNTDGTVSVINTVTNKVTTTIPVGGGPYGICVSPDGSHVYVANYNSASVSVIDAASNNVTATIPVGSYSYGIAVSPDGSRVYSASSYDNTLSEINTATNMVEATIPVGPHPYGVIVNADGTRVYVSSAYSNTITVVNTTDNTIATTITGAYVSDTPAMCLSPDGSKLYFVDIYIYVIDTSTNAIISSFYGKTPYSIAVSPDGSFLYMTDENSNSLATVDLATNTIVNVVDVGSNAISFGNFVTGPPCKPVKFTITVNPAPGAASAITAGIATGSISACFGTASASPQIQQFTVSGVNLSGDITAAANGGFEVSLTANGGYAASVTIPQTGGSVNKKVIYVRSAASDAAGSINGNVVLSSTGAPDYKVPVSGMVNALPTVNQVGNQTVANGATTTAINFTGTGNTYSWTNDRPGIGLAATGNGDISSFTAINTGTAPVIANITVTSANKQAGYEYMPNETTGQVSVISNVTNSIVATIDVDAGPYGIALSPDGSMAYVCNYIGSSVSVINTSTNKVVTTIPVGYNPIGIAVSPDGRRVYVCCNGGLYVLDALKNQYITGTPLGNYEPMGITVSPDGKWLYVANPASNSLLIVDAVTLLYSAVNIPTNITDAAFNVAVSPDGRLVYLTGAGTNNVYVISTASQSIVKTINLNSVAIGIALSPDGSRIYVTNEFTNTVSVIDAVGGTLITTVTVGDSPEGVSVSPDGKTVYVANAGSGNMTLINTANNQVIATVPTGPAPHALGNFIKSTVTCSGPPIKFTITVNTEPPTITVTQLSGTISACAGTASASPDVQQFSVSGKNLTANVVATASTGFEVSLAAAGGYGGSVTLTQAAGILSPVTVFVRSAASAGAGAITGNVVVSSSGATDKDVAVSGTINALPLVNIVTNQTLTNGGLTQAINFTGTGDTFTWVNDTPGIGLAANGLGDIAPFTAINTGSNVIIATITVTPSSQNSNCSGDPVTFTITVNPTGTPGITAAGTLTPLTTIYGTPSASETFSVSGINLKAGILVTPPNGFEVSIDNINFTGTVLVGSNGNITATNVYIRLAAKTPVGNYADNIVTSSRGARDATIAMPLSTVFPAPLTIKADDKTKIIGAVNPILTASYHGFVNAETQAQLTSSAVLATTAVTDSPVGLYPIMVNGAASPNYTITPVDGTLTIIPKAVEVIIPNTFTPNGDGVNDTWNIANLNYYPNCVVNIYDRWGQKVFTSIGYGSAWDGRYKGLPSPVGTYYYVINLENGLKPLSGYVAVIR